MHQDYLKYANLQWQQTEYFNPALFRVMLTRRRLNNQ